MQKIITGIDIGSHKTCTVIASLLEDSNQLSVIGVSTVKSQGIRKGQIVDIDKVVSSITQSVESAERMAGLAVSKAYVSISGSHITSKNSHGVVAVAEPDGEISAKDVSRVIDAASATSLPESLETLHIIPRFYTVDSQEGVKDPIGMTGVRLESDVHVIFGLATAVKNLERCVQDIGIEPIGLIASGVASSYSVLTETEKELGVILVDIGSGVTDICIFVEGSLAHTSVLPIGAKNITADLAIGLRISLDSAEKIKLAISNDYSKSLSAQKPGYKNKEKDQLDVSKLNLEENIQSVSRKTLINGIIKPRLNEIFELVAQNLKNSGLLNLTPAGVVLTGGGAKTVNISESAKQILKMPVRIGTPKRLKGLVEDTQTPEFSTAIGLLIFGNEQNKSRQSHSTFPEISDLMGKISIKGIAEKIREFVKSLLP